MSRIHNHLLGLLGVGATGCLLYTDPINVAPTIEVSAPASLHVGVEATFHAVTQDPDEDATALIVDWYRSGVSGAPSSSAPATACPRDLTQATSGPAPSASGQSSLQLTPTGLDTFCVWAVVTDAYGAQGFAAREVRVENRAPRAVLQLVSGPPGPSGTSAPAQTQRVGGGFAVPLFTEVRVSSEGSEDPDLKEPVKPRWSVQREGRDVPWKACGPTEPSDREICFLAESPGEHTVKLEVEDPHAALSAPEILRLTVKPDQPPCIPFDGSATEPQIASPIREPARPTSFAVHRVIDDGDPLPPPADRPTRSSFTWSFRMGRAGMWRRMAGFNGPGFEFPAGWFRPGDVVQVRVEYSDRENRRAALEAACKPDTLLCELEPKSGCYQWVTWSVEYR